MSTQQITTTVVNPARQTEPPKHALPSQPADGHKKSHLLTLILIAVVVLAGIGALVFFSRTKPRTIVMPPVAITVVKVHQGDISVSVPNLGTVTPVYTASISPRVDGQLITVNYQEGQMVKSNDLLAVIDPRPYDAVYVQMQGQLERDTNLLAGAYVDLKRYQAAYAKNAIAQQQLDDQLALVHQDEGTVRNDQGQLEAAKVNLDYCYIRAPFDGQVGLRMVDPGNIVHSANTNAIVVEAQLQPITVLFNVAEDYLPEIQDSLKDNPDMVVEAWDRDDLHKLATGKVQALNNQIDPATGTIRIRAIFANENMRLFPNQFVNARLIIKVLPDQLLIPTDAIQHNPEGAFVYLVTNHPPTNAAHGGGGPGGGAHGSASGEKASSSEGSQANTEKAGAAGGYGGTNGAATNLAWVTMQNITVGPTDGETTSVKTGLKPGDEMAFDNFNKLGEGVKVSVHPQGQPATGAAPGRHRGGSFGKSQQDTSDDNKANQ